MVTSVEAGEEFLSHHGIKGQRWGFRNAKTPNSGRTTFKKPPVRLSDEELHKRIKRLELEKKYTDLKAPTKSKGKEYVHSILENSGKTVAAAIVGGAATFAVQKALKAKFG